MSDKLTPEEAIGLSWADATDFSGAVVVDEFLTAMRQRGYAIVPNIPSPDTVERAARSVGWDPDIEGEEGTIHAICRTAITAAFKGEADG